MAVCGLNTHRAPAVAPVVSPPRIGGWLWVAMSYLIVVLISASLIIVIFLLALMNHWGVLSQTLFGAQWAASLLTAAIMWGFTFWTLRLMLKRSRRFPKVFILWLLAGIVLALKAFAFSPITDELALHQLYWPLLAAALGVPYIKRSLRVKRTFTQA
ncbi:DUF2569 domain-containing protein [Sodalis sp. dw_96]|uniref:DUF2569 domain-containing protein n=1 Tax=Sodalis sp. dw_96 TaxID=2719794 RepID=UPI001BD45389|nr:DUF2569 domain-containing protein [Sodalis sp. dw_96]